MKYLSLLVASSLVASATAASRALFTNQCSRSIYLRDLGSTTEPVAFEKDGSFAYAISPGLTGLELLLGPVVTANTWRSAINFTSSDSALGYKVFNLRGRSFADYPIKVTPKPDRADCPSTTFGWNVDKNAKVGGTCERGDEEVDLEIVFCDGHCKSGGESCANGETCCTTCVGSFRCQQGNSAASDIYLHPEIDP